MQPRMRMIAAGAAVALLTGTAGSAVAATSGTAGASASASSSSPAPKPSPTGTGTSDGKPGDQEKWLAQLAAGLHVSVQRLEAALVDAKQTIGRLGVAPTDPAVVSVVAHDLGISADKARNLLKEVFGDVAPGKGGNGKGGPGQPGKTPPPPGTPDPKVIQTFAGILHVSDARAAQVLQQLDRLGRGTSLDDPQFRAIAASLHLTPQQLQNDLIQLKETLRAMMPSDTGSAKAAPGQS